MWVFCINDGSKQNEIIEGTLLTLPNSQHWLSLLSPAPITAEHTNLESAKCLPTKLRHILVHGIPIIKRTIFNDWANMNSVSILRIINYRDFMLHSVSLLSSQSQGDQKKTFMWYQMIEKPKETFKIWKNFTFLCSTSHSHIYILWCWELILQSKARFEWLGGKRHFVVNRSRQNFSTIDQNKNHANI